MRDLSGGKTALGQVFVQEFRFTPAASYCFVIAPSSSAVRDGYSSPFTVTGTKGTVSPY